MRIYPLWSLNALIPRQYGRHFVDDIFKSIFLNEDVWISIKMLLNFIPKGPINNIPKLVQTMAWHRTADKPLSEAMVVSLLTYIYASLGLNELKERLPLMPASGTTLLLYEEIKSQPQSIKSFAFIRPYTHSFGQPFSVVYEHAL